MRSARKTALGIVLGLGVAFAVPVVAQNSWQMIGNTLTYRAATPTTTIAAVNITNTLANATTLTLQDGSTIRFRFDGIYQNFSTTVGSSGYGIRNNSGVPEVKSSGGSWLPILSGSGGTFVASITGTANQITASAATGAVTLSIPTTFIAPGTIEAVTSVTVGTHVLATTGLTLTGSTAQAAGPFIMNVADIQTALVRNLQLNNPTAATALVTVQNAPNLYQSGFAWQSSNSTSVKAEGWMELIPRSAATAAADYRWYFAMGGVAPNNAMTLTNAGALTTAGSITSGADLNGAATGVIALAGRININTPSTGIYTLFNGDASKAVRLDVHTTDGTLAILSKTSTDTAIARVNVVNATGKYQINGVDGISCTSAAAVTTVFGITTVCSAPSQQLYGSMWQSFVQQDIAPLKARIAAQDAFIAALQSQVNQLHEIVRAQRQHQ